MTDRIFKMILKDYTSYIVDTEKLYKLERLTRELNSILHFALVRSFAVKTGIYSDRVIRGQYLELLDMQHLLAEFQEARTVLEKESITVKEFFEYLKCKFPDLRKAKKLIMTAIVNNFLVEI